MNSMESRSRLNRQETVNTIRQRLSKFKNINWKIAIRSFLTKHKRKIFYTSILLIALLALIPPATYLYFAQDLKDKDSIMNRGKTGLTLMDRDGETFYTFYQPKEIKYISLNEITRTTQEAVIATEDKNFYTNPGFSIRGIFRAFFVNLAARRIIEGGSTITQELAKNAFLNSSRNVIRKYQEVVLASELNRRFSKQDILEMYLNSVYFGEGAFGIENAAQAYFGIPASQLTLSQSSLLIGLLPAPSAYSPISNPPQKALRRQKIVLDEMVEEGYITQNQADNALEQKLVYNTNRKEQNEFIAFHFANYIKNQLIKEYGEERVIREGFRVKTTLNRNFQKYAEQVVYNQVVRLTGNNASNGSAVAIDPKTGQILAMVGSYDWTDEKFGQTNMAVTPRQPGSSFKPIIYSSAIEDKLITAATILQDKETTFVGNYKPKNYDLRYRGDVTVRRALANSLNIPAVEVMEKVGVSEGISAAKNLGISSLGDDTEYGLSLVLGAAEVPLLEMTDAYAVFADQGIYHKPTGIITISNKYEKNINAPRSIFYFFNPLNWFKSLDRSEAKEVLSKETAFIISSILSDNRARAEVFGNALNISRPAAVKTGTTENYRDALTIGYTPSLVVGVWVGNNDNSPMDNIAGSLGAAPIWRNMMEHFLLGTPVESFEKPTFVVSEEVCAFGKSTGYTEFFIAGTQPQACSIPTSQPSPTPIASPTPEPTTQTQEPTSTQAPTIVQITQPAPAASATQTPITPLPTLPI